LKIKLITFIILVIAVLFIPSAIQAEDTPETTVPTNTIGSINGPGQVGNPTTTTGPFVEECLFVSGPIGGSAYPPGTGQGEYSFFECDLPTTTVVAVDEPPVPPCIECANKLPNTGIFGTFVFYLAIICSILGIGLMITAVRRF